MQPFHQTFKTYLLQNLSHYQLYVQISKQNIFEVVHLMLKKSFVILTSWFNKLGQVQI